MGSERTIGRGPSPRGCRLIAEDADLAGSLPANQRASAQAELVAPLLQLPRGPWHADWSANGAGLLVLSGLMIRRVGIDGRYGAELLGAGDLLRPWQVHDFASSLTSSTDFRLLSATRLAVLDERVTARLTRYPELSVALIEKAMRRARMLAMTMAILHQSRLETRLHMLLWLLADRWGRVRTDGTLLPLVLTHEVLSELIAARRPTVSAALAELARQQLVMRLGDGFLLQGGPPGEFLEIAA